MIDEKWMRELYWAAGFLEGEGSFYTSKAGHVRIQAPQMEIGPLQRLQSLFGGKIEAKNNGHDPHGALRKIWFWRLTLSGRSAGILMTLYPLMSAARQQQIATAIEKWKRDTRPMRRSRSWGPALKSELRA